MRYISSSGSTLRRCVILVLVILFISACGQESTAPVKPTEASKPNPQAAPEPLNLFHIRTPDNEVEVTLRWSSEEVHILFSEKNQKRFLRSRLGQTRQRRYHERGVGPVALVRTAADGRAFNLLSMQEKLWWRVRLGKKMATLEGATPKSAIQLLRPKAGIAQARREEGRVELGRALIRAKRIRILNAEGVLTHKVGRGAPNSLLYSLVNIDDIEPTARYILMAELLIREM